MKSTATAWFLLAFFLVSCASQRSAQKSGADRQRVADLRAKAENGDADAQCQLADCYHFGEGIAKDDQEAINWWRKAAEQNVAHAQANLGFCYANGQGVPNDDAEAVKWFRRAAEQDGDAKVALGFCYANGRGVKKDEAAAINLYREAGEGGNVRGFNNLAWVLATSADPAIRNGPNAIFFAEKAVAATKRKQSTMLDTLAAAYAEAGKFEKAVKIEQEAIALTRTTTKKNAYRSRLKLYEAKVPYHRSEPGQGLTER